MSISSQVHAPRARSSPIVLFSFLLAARADIVDSARAAIQNDTIDDTARAIMLNDASARWLRARGYC